MVHTKQPVQIKTLLVDSCRQRTNLRSCDSFTKYKWIILFASLKGTI